MPSSTAEFCTLFLKFEQTHNRGGFLVWTSKSEESCLLESFDSEISETSVFSLRFDGSPDMSPDGVFGCVPSFNVPFLCPAN